VEILSWYLVQLGWWMVCVLASDPGRALAIAERQVPDGAPARGTWKVTWYAAGSAYDRVLQKIPMSFESTDAEESRLAVTASAATACVRGLLIEGVNARQIGSYVWVEGMSIARVFADGEEFWVETDVYRCELHAQVWQQPLKKLLRPRC